MIVTRRSFLAGVGAATAGLALGLHRGAEAAGDAAAVFAPNPWIQIGSDGVVAIVCHRSEMGQGILSTLPVLIADELGADPAKIRVIQGDADERYGDQDTDGSSSIRAPYFPMRKVAAAAREMLIAAAAQRWKVAPDKCNAHDGAVYDLSNARASLRSIGDTGGARSLSFGELAVAAAKLPVPKDPKLRPNKELRYVGKELPLREAPDIVHGRAIYAADVRVPGMLTAVVARPPVLFGKVAKLDAARARAIPGVRDVVELPAPKPPIKFQALGGVAVIAEHTYAALRGRAALAITWDHGPNAAHDSAAYTEQLAAAVRAPGEVTRATGDADAALARAAKKVEAEYVVPYLAHAPMEPPAAVARVDGNRAEIWACTQSPAGVQDEVATALGIAKKDVTVHVTLLGGGFGRKSFPDFAVEAALLAKHAGAPVRVQWTRDDDLQHSSYHAISMQALAAGLDDHGEVVAWRHRVAYPPIGSTFDAKDEKPGASETGMGLDDLPLAVPNISVQKGAAAAHARIGWLRSVANIHQAFATQSFIAEVAHAAGRDHREMLLKVLGPPRQLTAKDQGIKTLWNYGSPLDTHPADVGRLRAVIDKVTEMARWGQGSRALGLAAHRSFVTYVAVVAHVVKGPRGEPRVEEAWIAADAGTVVNPDRVRFQMEGAFVFGLSNALHGAITYKNGAVEQHNFRDYKLLRMPEAPRAIHVELVASDAPPGGAGEPGVPPVAPAIANGWFALTGERLRKMPFVSSP